MEEFETDDNGAFILVPIDPADLMQCDSCQ